MHVEKRKIKNETKYYLAHTLRIDGKVRKIRVYLGNGKNKMKNKKSAKIIIEERISAYMNISNPFNNVLNNREIEEIKTLAAIGNIKIKHLSEDDWNIFSKAFVYDTNAIEGSTVTYKEVGDILEKQEWPEDRRKWEISETYGLHDAIKHIRNTKIHITLELMKELHGIVFKNSKTFAGEFRKKGQEVAVADSFGKIIHRGAPSHMVMKLLRDLVRWYNKNKGKYPPIVLAAVVHNQFEVIHPFADGNGRVGRLLLNNILLKHNKPPVNIELKNREKYYIALREYQDNGNIRPMIELILKEYKNLKKLLHR